MVSCYHPKTSPPARSGSQCSAAFGGHMCKPVSVTPTALFESLRALRVAEPNLGVKPLIAQLQKQQPDLGACKTKEVREALKALKKESEAKVATAAPRTADVAPSPVALSLTCIGCARLPSDIDDEKHPICDKSRDQQLSQAEAWQLHGTFHSKALKENQKASADGGVHQQRKREVAQRVARDAALSGDKHDESCWLRARGMLLSRTIPEQPGPLPREENHPRTRRQRPLPQLRQLPPRRLRPNSVPTRKSGLPTPTRRRTRHHCRRLRRTITLV